MNNFEKIKGMNVSEMSMWLEKYMDCDHSCPISDFCVKHWGVDCNECLRKWLESPTEESE